LLLLACVYIICISSLWQNLFHPLVLQVCGRKNRKDNKKNMAFLLV
jgi:hypothetical protein